MNKRLIICVDDEKVVLNSLKEQLLIHLPKTYRIETAESGDEALEIIDEYEDQGYEVLLVISDYVMPGMNGDELLEHIHAKHPDSVKILLTGQATLEGISQIINKAGLFRFIQKPWQKEDLILSTVEAIKSYEKDRQIETQNQELLKQNQSLNDWAYAFVDALGFTLDSRDTTTSGHSTRMAYYAEMLAKAIDASNEPPFATTSFDEFRIDALRIAALLHDVGKIGIREHILLKNKRLSDEHLKLIKQRYQFLRCLIHNESKTREIKPEEKQFLEHIEETYNQIAALSTKDKLTDEDLDYIQNLAHTQFYTLYGEAIGLLTEDEADVLSVQFGNLTPKERQIIQSHAMLTHTILSGIPWPPHLKDVPEIAASHHERLDGSGYYKGLKGDELSTETRILGILDVFEALTSTDRPYHRTNSLEEAFAILEDEVNRGRMDGDILAIFKKIILTDKTGGHHL